jgi:hypothetical protein
MFETTGGRTLLRFTKSTDCPVNDKKTTASPLWAQAHHRAKSLHPSYVNLLFMHLQNGTVKRTGKIHNSMANQLRDCIKQLHLLHTYQPSRILDL